MQIHSEVTIIREDVKDTDTDTAAIQVIIIVLFGVINKICMNIIKSVDIWRN